ncbi:hypothetical protein SEVIR_6G240500v4 [Setaria viridis]|uniref:Transcription factor n=1 Tax=Setaria viridis TaxID=4556 RepID=A0A4U6UA67_SETVI|nr:transcription factor MYC2-like [Setaria viridis]TKW11565.1 hypothetical protein SEVIR_6G240500v2 [Setaria viridis]
MDELACPSSSCSPPHSPASLFSFAGGHHPVVLEFESCDVPEQWLEDDGEGLQETLWANGAVWRDGASPPSAGKNMSGNPTPPPAPTKRRRGWKPGPRTNGPVISHVEAERQRRDKLNRRFCELRAAVPTVSRMDRASLLADAAAYIAELRGRVQHQLEAESKKASAAVTTVTASAHSFAGGGLAVEEDLEVRMLGREAAVLRLTSAARHAPERLMVALRSLDLPVQHAYVCRVGGMMTVKDAVVDVPAALGEEGRLRAALLQSLQGGG